VLIIRKVQRNASGLAIESGFHRKVLGAFKNNNLSSNDAKNNFFGNYNYW